MNKAFTADDLTNVLKWFEVNKIDYPWSVKDFSKADAYAVWVSEVMLQQTTVSSVLPRYRQWMERFPTLSALSKADLEDVLREWEGLGYYSRAKNLHSAAKELVSRYAGRVPDDATELRSLPGVGEYIAAALSSIAFGNPAPAVDANIRRIIQRFLAAESWDSSLAEGYVETALTVMKTRHAGEVNAAMMQFGQQVCLPRSPRCTECPLELRCRARKRGLENAIPKRQRKELIRKSTDVALLLHEKQVWISRKPSGIVAGLWVFPPVSDIVKPHHWEPGECLDRQIHSYTRYRDELCPRIYRPASSASASPTDRGKWTKIDRLSEYGMPSAYRRIADELSVLRFL